MFERFTYNDLPFIATDNPDIAKTSIPKGFIRLCAFKKDKAYSVQMPLNEYNDDGMKYQICAMLENKLINA